MSSGLLRHLADNGILGTFHYVPLASTPFGRVSGSLYGDLTEAESARVVDAVTSYEDGCELGPG